VISGTTRDGIYLEVTDQRGGDTATDVDYALDTPPGKAPDELPSDGVALPYGQAAPNQMRPSSFVTTRSFDPGTTAGAELLKDPLWYAAKYGGFQEDKIGANNLPDKKEEWDTDNDGDPDNYFLVTNALKLGEQLSKAFDAILKRNTASASASVNSGTINEDTRIYQAQFTTGDWSGDIVAYPVLKDDPSTPLVNEAGQIDDAVWSAKSQVPAAGSRKIFTTNTNGSVVPFTWSDLDDTRKGLLGSTVVPPMGIAQAEARLNYLRGDRSGELRNGGTMRDRNVNSVLGDFVSSSPFYVGTPRAFYPDLLEGASNRYSTWRLSEDMQDRTKMIYAGANDGMLHAFDASTGKELWAFIPTPVFKNLSLLTTPTYQHKFFVDGAAMAVDAFVDSEWKTILVGGLNNGGQGVYALDVTYPDPANVDEAGEMLMWEFTDADDADLGYTYSRPTVAKLADGKWYAIFGNGYNNTVVDGAYSSTGNAVLYVVELADKSNFYKFDTLAGGSTPNGLSSVSVVDFNDDGISDYAYAGDLQGNLWKFTFKDANPSNWGFAHKTGTPAVPTPLFVAKDDANIRQPITTRPQVGFGRRGEGLMVLFGTGKFLEPNDRVVSLATPQTFYGLWDKNKGLSTDILSSGRGDLAEQTIDVESMGVRVTSKNDVSSKRGWYMDLLPVGSATSIGEMQVTNSVLRNRRIIFTTQIPNEDPCGFGGTSWIMELDYLSGGRLNESPFDINGDGKFDANDLISYTQGGTDYKNPPSGIQSENGILSQPAFLTSGNREWMYLSTSNNDDRKDEDDPDDDDDCDDATIKCEENAVPANAYGRQSWRQVR
jgi:type IV pilus assembly protein PilY1